VDIKDIKAIIDLMKKNAVSEFELEKQDFKIRLKRGIGNSQSDDVVPMIAYPTMPAATVMPAQVAAPATLLLRRRQAILPTSSLP
jgi:acetyl-CoA carboxylase biotin carboxyl carrier protein